MGAPCCSLMRERGEHFSHCPIHNGKREEKKSMPTCWRENPQLFITRLTSYYGEKNTTSRGIHMWCVMKTSVFSFPQKTRVSIQFRNEVMDSLRFVLSETHCPVDNHEFGPKVYRVTDALCIQFFRVIVFLDYTPILCYIWNEKESYVVCYFKSPTEVCV